MVSHVIETQTTCWFCRKGRHNECMKEMPTECKSDGPHDCTFDTMMIPCKCSHQTNSKDGKIR